MVGKVLPELLSFGLQVFDPTWIGHPSHAGISPSNGNGVAVSWSLYVSIQAAI